MPSKKFLLIAVAALGLGCAGAVETPPLSAQRAHRAPKREVKTLRPVGVAKATQTKPLRPVRSEEPRITPEQTPQGGVSLHGPDKSYIESFDPSGWGGPSTPRGGGPTSWTDEDPYEESGLDDEK